MEVVSVWLRAATFFLAIFGALVALQLYNLIKTGDLAATWRSFIIGALVFAVWALADFANAFCGDLFEQGKRIALVMDLLRALFIALFVAGLWAQRQMFYHPDRMRPAAPGADGVEIEHDDGLPPEPDLRARLDEDDMD